MNVIKEICEWLELEFPSKSFIYHSVKSGDYITIEHRGYLFAIYFNENPREYQNNYFTSDPDMFVKLKNYVQNT